MATLTARRLRPLGLGQLFDQAIRLYRRNFFKFIAIIAVVQIPVVLLQTLFGWLTIEGSMAQLERPGFPATDNPFELLGPGYFVGIAGSCLIGIVALLLVQGAATAALTRAVTDQYLGRPVTFVDAYRRVGRSWLPLVGALLLAGLLSLALVIWFVVPCVGWITGLGMLVFFGLVITPLIAPIVVLEERRALQAIRRAWDLSRRRFWWTIGFATILFLFNQVVVSGPTTLVNALVQFLAQDWIQSGDLTLAYTIQTIAQSLVTLVFSLLYLPLQQTSYTLMYFDLRIRTEGFDLALMADDASNDASSDAPEAEGVDIERIVTEAPAPEASGLLTWNEMGSFALFTVAAGVVLFALWSVLVGVGMLLFSLTGGPGL